MKNKGFSLVELIVVIAIMAILVGVAVPVYTSYIGKANAAKDEQLLSEINSAFMVAAIDNQIDFDFLTPENNKITVAADGTITFALYANVTDGVDLNTTIKTILPDTYKFNTYTGVYYNPLTRQFTTTIVASYGGSIIIMDPEDIEALKNSVFGSMGMDELLDKVGYATGLVSDLDVLMNGEQLTTLGNLVLGGESQLQKYLGFDPEDETDDEAFNAKLQELYSERAALLAIQNGGNAEDYMEQAELDVLANNAVLIAATQSEFDANELVSILGSGEGSIKSELKNTQDPQLAIAKTAMAYAMYTAYIEETDQEPSDDPLEVLAALESEAFKTYMQNSNTQKNVNGYLAAMSMINDSCNEPDAVSHLLVNGFSDDELKGILNNTIGK